MDFFNIQSADLELLKEVSLDALAGALDYDKYVELYGETVKGYLAGINLSVVKETTAFYNGLNFHLIIMAKDSDKRWKIIEYSNPSAMLVDKTLEKVNLESMINSSELKQAQYIIQNRTRKGLFLNMNNEEIPHK